MCLAEGPVHTAMSPRGPQKVSFPASEGLCPKKLVTSLYAVSSLFVLLPVQRKRILCALLSVRWDDQAGSMPMAVVTVLGPITPPPSERAAMTRRTALALSFVYLV